MPEVDYSTTARLPVGTIWDFVHEMDNWAHLMTGYQRHEKESDTRSLWTLKGDVGVLARTLTFRVDVTEWNGPERVGFELEGVNEPMKGSGYFEMTPYEDASSVPAEAPARKGALTRLAEAVARFFHRIFAGGERARRGEGADAGPGTGMSRLSFHLRIDPGGPMAPMISAMMKAPMAVAAEDLANKIIGHLEEQRDAHG